MLEKLMLRTKMEDGYLLTTLFDNGSQAAI